jgi:anti-sigma regulatory factor (Ser/Thr protein kinase)
MPDRLLSRSDDSGDGEVLVTADLETAVAVLTVGGCWSRRLSRDVFQALHKCLPEHPSALIIDLLALSDPHAHSGSTWMTARRVAESMQPPVRVVACVPPRSALAGRLHRLGAIRFLPVFTGVPEARTALAAGLPLTQRARLRLPPEPETVALARNLVTDACSGWHLPEVIYKARLVMSELAGNAVMHARTPIDVIVVRRGRGVHLIVGDGDRRLPRVIDRPEPFSANLWEAPGLGLRTVQAAAAAWGALPTKDGKMVWATIRP